MRHAASWPEHLRFSLTFHSQPDLVGFAGLQPVCGNNISPFYIGRDYSINFVTLQYPGIDNHLRLSTMQSCMLVI